MVYDANAHLSLEYTPTGQNYIFGQNALGQPTEVAIQSVKTYVGGASYWPDGKLAQYTYANGIVHTLTENTRGLPATIEDTGNGTTALDQTLSYDADGDPTAISDTGNSAQTRSLTYDGLDRLQSATVAYAGTAPTSYQYDVLDNLAEVDRGAHTQAFQYNADNQLSAVVNSFGGLTENAVQIIPYTYDAQGNLATRGGVQYTFDYGNRLRQVSGEESGYLYDGWGRRVEQVDATTGEQTLSMYTRDGQLIYQQLPGGAAKDYQYLGNRLVAIRDYANGVATQMQYEHTDAEGTVVAQTDANAKETETSVYDSYGALLNRPAQEEPGYTGQMEDALTGLTYMQQRYYDPSVGRFLSIDPVTADGNTGGNFNRYWYASDNPYRYTDPFGMCTGSHITNSDGSCASTGGDTTGTNGAAQGLNKALAAAKQAAIGVAKGVLNTLEGWIPHPQDEPTAFGIQPYDENAPLTASNGIQAGGMVAGGILASAGIAALDDPAAAEGAAIQTPYALEVQSNSAAARAALGQVQSGATLYRTGTLGSSMTAESQYWSLQNPLGPGYAGQMGVPNGTPNFIISGALSPGASVITNEARGLGANAGGGIQVVTSPGGVTPNSFTMPYQQ